MDEHGTLDLSAHILQKLDWVIASMHTVVLDPMDCERHTRAWLGVAENPDVDVLGHTGDSHYAFDHERVIEACARHKKLVEINAHSFLVRPGSPENCRAIARCCARHGVSVVISSDAHFAGTVGAVERSVAMLEEIGFPEELVLNADSDRFARFLKQKTGRDFAEGMPSPREFKAAGGIS
jgi:putative hydrolase